MSELSVFENTVSGHVHTWHDVTELFVDVAVSLSVCLSLYTVHVNDGSYSYRITRLFVHIVGNQTQSATCMFADLLHSLFTVLYRQFQFFYLSLKLKF